MEFGSKLGCLFFIFGFALICQTNAYTEEKIETAYAEIKVDRAEITTIHPSDESPTTPVPRQPNPTTDADRLRWAKAFGEMCLGFVCDPKIPQDIKPCLPDDQFQQMKSFCAEICRDQKLGCEGYYEKRVVSSTVQPVAA